MVLPIIGDIITAVGNLAGKALDKIAGDKIDEATREKIKADITIQLAQMDLTWIEKQVEVILAEAKSESSLARNWRPILMLTIVAIVANNYVIAPYLGLIINKSLMLELPEKLWNLLTLGVGGYVVGRSAEKIAESKWGNK